MSAEEETSPVPRKVTVIDGVIFNPWVNIVASLVCTIGIGWMTVRFWGLFRELVAAPAYEDQGLDVVGTLIGVVVGGLVTVALFVVTIGVVVWWAKRGWTISGDRPRR